MNQASGYLVWFVVLHEVLFWGHPEAHYPVCYAKVFRLESPVVEVSIAHVEESRVASAAVAAKDLAGQVQRRGHRNGVDGAKCSQVGLGLWVWVFYLRAG